ncbi:MAG: UDP-glucose/GDP-mannose dehydrogenase family protein [Bryobacteraceae bacterium]|jgi:UDPglucose 6-dehydrogenase
MKVSIVGAGYVGITTGVALAYLGHTVTLLDSDESKIGLLRQGKFPIYEPFLEEFAALAQSRLRYTTDAAEAHPEADVIFIAVGTPPLPDGNPDLSYLRAAATAVGERLGDSFTVVVNKSTVPIGCGNWVEALVREAFEARNGRGPKGRFSVASNPEFLREGSALHDSLYPDRVVVGSDDPRALDCLYALYRPVVEQTFPAPNFLPRPESLGAVPLITTNLASAELVKYAANAFLALKISFMNEIAQLAEKVGADATQISKGIGLDARIGTRFLQAGIGWGGSCFGKDTAALIATAREYNLTMPIVAAAREVNYRQRDRVLEKLLGTLKILKGRTVGLLGLAFKPHTDDLRDAPALDIARRLAERGAKVRAHDPIALDRARRECDSSLSLVESVEQLAADADALVLVTEWPQYRDLPWARLAELMRTPLLLDGRNFLDQAALEAAGFQYIGMGR